MKRKELIKKGIAGCMAALMTLSSMPVPPAYASDDASTELDVSEEAAEGSNERESDAASEEVAETISPLSITPYVPEVPETTEPEEEDLPANVLKGKEERYGLYMQLTSDKDFPENSESWLSIIQDGNQIQEYLGDINESILAKNNQQASGYILPIEISVFDSADEDRKELKDLGKINVNIETESAGEVNGYRLFHMKADESWEELAFKVDGKDINFEADELGKFIWVNVPGGDGESDKVVAGEDKVVADEAVNDSQQEENGDITMTTAGELKDKKPESEENKKNDISKDLTVNDVKPQEESGAAGNEEGEKEAEKKAEADEETGNVNDGTEGTGKADKKENAGIAEGEEVGDAEGRDEAGKEKDEKADEEEVGVAESKDEAGEEAGEETGKAEGEEASDEEDEKTGKEGDENEKADAEQAGDESDIENVETEGKEENWTPDKLDEETGSVQTEAIPSGSVFDAVQNVNGVNVRVHAQAGVFPDGCSMQAEEVSNTEIQERVADAISKAEYQNPVKSYYYNITIYDKDGNEIEPDTTKGKVSVSFDMYELQDKNLDAAVYHIDDNFNADMLGSVNNSLAVIESGTDAGENKVDAEKEAGKEGAADAGEAADNKEEKAETDIDENVDEVAGDRKNEVAGTGETEDETANAADEMSSSTDAAVGENMANEEAGESGNYGYDDNGSLMINSSMSDEGLTVSTNAFSFYAVSFTYNEKSYDMMAGEEVDLSRVKSGVGLSGDITNAVSSDESKLIITKEETTDSSGNTSVVWKAKPDEAFDGTATLTLTIKDVDYVINVTVVNSYDKFALLFEDGTLIFVNKSRDLEPLIAEHGEITHKYVVSETSGKHDWNKWHNGSYDTENIKKVIVMDTIRLTNANGYFAGCSNVKEFVGLENMDMSECTDMSGMFNGCSLLKEIDLSMWNVSNISFAMAMFGDCAGITNINLSGWNLKSVTNMNDIFSGFINNNQKLEYIDLSEWLWPNINSINVKSLLAICDDNKQCYFNLNSWGMPNATSASGAFAGQSANTISVKNWSVSNVKSFYQTFVGTNINNIIGLQTWDVSSGTNFSYMFYSSSFKNLDDIETWDMSKAEQISDMFSTCRNLKQIDLTGWNVKNVKTATCLFTNCTSIESINLHGWELDSISSVQNILGSIVSGDTNLQVFNLSGWSLPEITHIDFSAMRDDKCNLDCLINLDDWKFDNATSMEYAFSGFTWRNISIKNWDVSKITSFEGAFQSTTAYRLPALSDWDVSSGTNFQYMFRGSKFEILDLSKWNMYNAENIYDMFVYMSNIKSIDISNWHLKNLNDNIVKGSIIFSCSVKTIKMNNWIVDNFSAFKYSFIPSLVYSIPNADIEFKNLTILHSDTKNLCVNPNSRITAKSIDISGWVLPEEINDFRGAFCNNDVEYINCDSWKINSPESLIVDGMFNNCRTAKIISFTNWNQAPFENNYGALCDVKESNKIKIASSASMFANCPNLSDIIFTNWRFTQKQKTDTPNTSNMFQGSKNEDYDLHVSFINCLFECNMKNFLQVSCLTNNFKPYGSILDFSSSTFRTDNVSYMLANTNFETIKMNDTKFQGVINLSYMFANNKYLKNIVSTNIHHEGNVINITGMFQNSSVDDVNLSNITQNAPIKEARNVFRDCLNLKKAVCTNLNFVSNNGQLDIDGFFGRCNNLNEIDCSNWRSPDVTTLQHVIPRMFTDTQSGNVCQVPIRKITINDWNFLLAIDFTGAFSSMYNLQQLICQRGNLSPLYVEEMLAYNYSLQKYDISGIDLSRVRSLRGFFKSDFNLTTINHNDFNFMKEPNNVQNLDYFVADCHALKQIDVSKWNTKSVKTATNFTAYTNIKSLNLSNWNTCNIQDYGLDGFAGSVSKIKLGSSFRFPAKYRTFGLSYSLWNHIKDGETDLQDIDLWNQYDGSDEMIGVWVQSNPSEYDSTMYLNGNISYDTSTNTIFNDIELATGQTVAKASFPDLRYENVKIKDDFLKHNADIQKAIQNNGFENHKFNYQIRLKTNFDVASCSTEDNVIWTFNVPKGNKDIITMQIQDESGNNIGYIQNSKNRIDEFTQYDKDWNPIETLRPGNRHSYQDLGYQTSKHIIYIWNDETKKNDIPIETYYLYCKDVRIYKDKNQYGYNPSFDKLLSDYIYPEYKDYISYDEDMYNYESIISPGHYSLIIMNDKYKEITLNPDKIITKKVDKTDENGNKITDENGNIVTEDVPYEYQYKLSKSITNENDTTLTVFNNIYEDTQTINQADTISCAAIDKVNQYGSSIVGAVFLLQSQNNRNWYMAKGGRIDWNSYLSQVNVHTDNNGNILWYTDTGNKRMPLTNESFYGYEFEPPEGYTKTPQSFYITFKSMQSTAELVTKSLIYSDGVTTKDTDTSACNTCMVYGNCTCEKFGKCICTCCGATSGNAYKYLDPIKIINQEKPYEQDHKKVKITKKIDNENKVSEKIKEHTSFTFSIYDETAHSKFVCSKTIKYGESFTLGYNELDTNHTYHVVEESFYNDVYMPKDNSIVDINNKNAESYYWNSNNAYLEFTYNDSYNSYDKEYTFTNHYNQQKHNITVEKHLTTNNSANKDTSTDFNFTMQLTNPLLSLSDFEITYQKSDGSSGKVTLDSDGKYTFTLKDGQTIKFLDVPDVTTYKFTEEKSGIYHTKDDGTAKGMLLEKDANVTFNNDRIDIINLPKTGGDGNTLPYAMLFVVTVSLVAAARREKKKQKR